MKAAAIAVITLGVVLAAGCGTSHPAASPAAKATTAPASSSAAAPSPTASNSPTTVASAPLTVPEAAAEYVKLVDRANRISDAMSTDDSDEAPFTQFQADARADVRALRVLNRKLLAVTWPPNVEPWVRAMVTTYDVANIACDEVMAAAGSYTAVNTVDDTNASCQAGSSQTDPDEIRSLLGLPAAPS